MKRIPADVYQLFGPPPARWRGGRAVAHKKDAEFKKLRDDGYEALYDAMGFRRSKGLGRAGLTHATKVQLVALVRVAAKLYQDAQAARSIMDRWTKNGHESSLIQENDGRIKEKPEK